MPWGAYTPPRGLMCVQDHRLDIQTWRQLLGYEVLGYKVRKGILGRVQPLPPVQPRALHFPAQGPGSPSTCLGAVLCLSSLGVPDLHLLVWVLFEGWNHPRGLMSFPPDPITTLLKALCLLHDWGLDWAGPTLLSVLVSARGWQEEMSWIQVLTLLCISRVPLGQTAGPQFQNQVEKEAVGLLRLGC